MRAFAICFSALGCSAVDSTPPTEADGICSNTGIGNPAEGEPLPGKVGVDWIIENHFAIVSADCLSIPPLRVYSTEDGDWPVTFLGFSLTSYDNADWVNPFGDELTIQSSAGELGSHASIEPGTWEVDLTNYDLTVNPDEDIYLEFGLPGFDDPSMVDELWDDQPDKLILAAYAGHGWTEEIAPGQFEFEVYMGYSLFTLFIEVVE